MAEEQRMWSRRHVHESSTVSYGQYGTPSYDRSSQDWSFLRQDDSTRTDEEESDTKKQKLLEIFTKPKELSASADSLSGGRYGRLTAGVHAQIAPAAPLVKAIDKSKSAESFISHKGHLIAFGSAVWLGADGTDSGNLTVPVFAFASGSTDEVLHLSSLGREQIEFIPENNTGRRFRVPSLTGDLSISKLGKGPILQILFSQPNDQRHGDTFLLVRRSTHITIFEPLLHRDAFANSVTHCRSSLDLNQLVTLEAQVTGGHALADAAFHPLNHRILAVTDEEGNWTTWEISGRRSTTARVLYQVRLLASGKVFSWKTSKRPAGVGLFFDGWHKVVWLSSSGHMVDRLLVCNRRIVKVFDTTGEEVCSIDPRLATDKAMYILDAQAGPMLNLCFILTTTRLFVFDLAQKEWKNPPRYAEPLLICGFQHFHNAGNASLWIAKLTLGDQILLGLHSPTSLCVDIRQLVLSQRKDGLSVTVSDTSSLKLPISLSQNQVTSIILSRAEAVRTVGDPLPSSQELVLVTARCQNSSIHSFWAMASKSTQSKSSVTTQCILRLPPSRSLHSNRYAEDTRDYEDDIESFMVSDDEDVTLWPHRPATAPHSSVRPVTRTREVKRVSLLVDALQQHSSPPIPQSGLDIGEILRSYVIHARDMINLDGRDFKCTTLSDIIPESTTVREVEAESETFQQAISELAHNLTEIAISQCSGESAQTLLSTYKHIFDTFVDSLPADVPGRFRAQKERQDRHIALEQYLSRHTVNVVPKEVAGALEGQETVIESQMIFSDPIEDDSLQREQHMQSISASQPLPQTSTEPQKSRSMKSPLPESISRLQAYAKIDRAMDETSSAGLDTFLSVFSHLPASCDEDPNTYDYQATTMSIAAEKAEADGGSAKPSTRAQRKTDKLARARRRAEASTPSVNFLISGEHDDKEAGNSAPHAQSKSKGILPIRSVGDGLPAFARRGSPGQSQDRHALSDGHVLPESSSQPGVYGGFTHTQPERGTFASRIEANSQGKPKKKRRVAGF